jgi:kynurenine formamidase
LKEGATVGFVDLSHDFADGMPGFRLRNEDGTFMQFTASVRPFLTHEQTRPKYQNLASFEITEMTFQTSIGTYLDSPFHRHPDGRDIGDLQLEEVILPGVVIDARGRGPFEPVGPEVIPTEADLRGAAALVNFGWDDRWGDEDYNAYPFLAAAAVDQLIERGVKLLGVDALNVDDTRDPVRPTHTRLLARDILIVENLTSLAALHGRRFRFFAVPIKARRTASMPVRAFAELE